MYKMDERRFKEIIEAIPIEPYYRDPLADIVIYKGDNRSVLLDIPQESADLILTDPPYDIEVGLLRRIWELTMQDMKDKANLVWTFGSCRLQVIGQSLIPELSEIRTAVWHKPFCPSPWRFGWSWHWEPIIWWMKGNDRKGISRYKFLTSDVISVNVIRPTDEHRTNHHDQKPEALWSQLITWFTNVGDLILDPFLGSGTTCYCAKKLNRKCIGIEIEEKYCEIAANRCSQTVMNLGV
jgi:DNA modification methylase